MAMEQHLERETAREVCIKAGAPLDGSAVVVIALTDQGYMPFGPFRDEPTVAAIVNTLAARADVMSAVVVSPAEQPRPVGIDSRGEHARHPIT